MKKAWSLLCAVLLTANLTAALPTAAEDAQRSIMDYSFEELLAMSDEEICSISSEVEYDYHGGTLQKDDNIMTYLVMFYSDEPYLMDKDTKEVNGEKVISAMGLPAEMVRFRYNEGIYDDEMYLYFTKYRIDDNTYPCIEVFIDLNVYPEYDPIKVCHTVNAVLSNNPAMPWCHQVLTVGGSEDSASKLGDVDANGTVNAADAAEVLVKAAEIGAGDTAVSNEFSLMDVNSDRQINAADASVILTYAALVGTSEDVPDFAEHIATLKEAIGVTENFE